MRRWTAAERHRCVAMWKSGSTIAAIATALNRTRRSINSHMMDNRDLYPYRNKVNGTHMLTNLTLRVTRDFSKRVEIEAKRRGMTKTTLMRKAIEDALD